MPLGGTHFRKVKTEIHETIQSLLSAGSHRTARALGRYLASARHDCSVCQSKGSLIYFERRRDIDGKANDIYICRKCLVLANVSVKCDESSNIRMQKEASEYFYQYAEDDIRHLGALVDANKHILRAVIPYLDPVTDKDLLEIGSGRGLLLIAASELGFRRAIGVDYNVASFAHTKRLWAVKNNVHLYSSLDLIPGDVKAHCLVMWHTLEHILNPNQVFEILGSKLSDDCLLFAQVPQYHQAHLCSTHYYFYNEPSIRALLAGNGFRVIAIEYDLERQFMAVIARRAGRNPHNSDIAMQKS